MNQAWRPNLPRGRERWAWVPAPIFFVLLAVLESLNLQNFHESWIVLFISSFLCTTVASGVVSILIGRSFMASGGRGLLFLIVGALLWGCAGPVGPVFLSRDDNAIIASHNLLAWLAGICHFIGVIIAGSAQSAVRYPGPAIGVAYFAAVLIIGFVVVLGIAHTFPVFFVQGQGGTPVRFFVLGSAVCMFVATGVLLFNRYWRAPTAFSGWYGGAMLLIGAGLFGIMIQSRHGGVVGWTSRGAQFLGSAFMLIAALKSVSETGGWKISLEAAMRHSERRLQNAVDLVELAPYSWDPATGALDWHPRLKAMFGLPPEAEVTYEMWVSAIHPDDRAAALEAIRHTLDPDGDGIFKAEYRVIGIRDGIERWLSVIGRTAFHNRKPVAYDGVAMEITERKRAEMRNALLASFSDLFGRIRESDELLRIATGQLAEHFNTSRCGFSTVDVPGNALTIRVDAYRGVPSMAGTYPLSHYAEAQRADALAGRVTVVSNTELDRRTAAMYVERYLPLSIRSFVTVPLMRDGDWVGNFWLAHHLPRTWSETEVEFFRSLAERIWLAMENRRVTAELRAAHEILADRARQLESLIEDRTASLQTTVSELEAFSYSLSHDMRAPLRAIQGFSQIVLHEASDRLSQHERDLLQKSVNAASRLDRLIRDVLTYSTVARTPIQLEPIDTDKLLRQIIHERPEFQEPRAIINVVTPLPKVLGHEAFLTQCFTNLLDNGIKFVGPESRPVITISADSSNGHTRLQFQDNGIGISQKLVPRLFGLFERGHAESAFPGTGIGLAIVRKAMERMGGEAGFDPTAEQGSRFWLKFQSPE